MPIYQGTAIKNVFDLINRDNPTLPFPVNESTMIVGLPVAIALTPQKHDTQIRLSPKAGSMYRGGITLTYRRINLPQLLRENKPRIQRFLASRWYTMTEFLPLINNQFGLNFSLVDFQDTNTLMHGTYAPEADFTLTTKATSLMYTGAATFRWVQDKEELGVDIMATAELGGGVWPSNAKNDFTAWDDRRAYGTWLFWDRHFTEEAVAGSWPSTAQTTSVNTDNTTSYGGIGKLYADAFVNQDLEINFGVYHGTNNPKGIGTKTLNLKFIILPDAAYPEVNRAGFSYAAVMYPTDSTLYAKYGRTVMYYNK
jgi:hypothetical protein